MDVVMQSTFPMSIEEQSVLPFLVRVGLCNRFTYNYNYHDEKASELVLKIPKVSESVSSEMPLKKLIEQLLLLDYNCVTNSGRCFLDSKDKELLDELVYHLRLRYIETLESQKR
jgi:hypothetical protein